MQLFSKIYCTKHIYFLQRHNPTLFFHNFSQSSDRRLDFMLSILKQRKSHEVRWSWEIITEDRALIEELPRPVRPRVHVSPLPSGVPNHSTQLRCAKRKVGSRRHESERYKQKVQTTNYGPLRLKANQPPTSHSAIGNWRIKSEDPGLSTEAPRTQDREDMLAKDISGFRSWAWGAYQDSMVVRIQESRRRRIKIYEQ